MFNFVTFSFYPLAHFLYLFLGQATSDVLKIVIQARQRALGPLHPSFNLMKTLRQGLRRNLPEDSHKVASGRLHISLTRFSDGQNVIVNQFDSKEELIQVPLKMKLTKQF